MKYTTDEILEIYENAGKILYEATLNGDYKSSNKEGKRLIKIFKIFEKETEFGHQCIDRLFESSNIVIKTEAAAYCLALNYKVPYAESVLQEIADNPDNKIFGFNAKMTLKVWKQNGYLEIYQKK
ncbi:MAG: hypothetical protein PUC37_01940 [Spirochaetales bacterium]|nr:hypothetical protein [Spirochaetales bacterium]